jgi:prophage regulatory protein
MQPETGTKWLSDQDVASRYGVSRITVWRWSKAGQFPKPRKLGANTTRWLASEIEAHDAALIAETETS